MKKIKLNLNQLKVDSFETNESKNISGTVKGHSDVICDSIDGTCYQHTCKNGCTIAGQWHTCYDIDNPPPSGETVICTRP